MESEKVYSDHICDSYKKCRQTLVLSKFWNTQSEYVVDDVLFEEYSHLLLERIVLCISTKICYLKYFIHYSNQAMLLK